MDDLGAAVFVADKCQLDRRLRLVGGQAGGVFVEDRESQLRIGAHAARDVQEHLATPKVHVGDVAVFGLKSLLVLPQAVLVLAIDRLIGHELLAEVDLHTVDFAFQVADLLEQLGVLGVDVIDLGEQFLSILLVLAIGVFLLFDRLAGGFLGDLDLLFVGLVDALDDAAMVHVVERQGGGQAGLIRKRSASVLETDSSVPVSSDRKRRSIWEAISLRSATSLRESFVLGLGDRLVGVFDDAADGVLQLRLQLRDRRSDIGGLFVFDVVLAADFFAQIAIARRDLAHLSIAIGRSFLGGLGLADALRIIVVTEIRRNAEDQRERDEHGDGDLESL